MFNFSSNPEKPKKLSGPGYIILNVIRVFNIISLLTVVVGSWIMLVRTVETSNFFFFDGVSHFITSSIGIFLIISELTLFQNYFARNWPLLSESSGFVFLGSAMLILGFNILGNLNKTATSITNLGLPLWRVVIAGGILSAVMGMFNIIATYIFGNSKDGISARQVRSKGASIPPTNFTSPKSVGSVSSRDSSSRRPASMVLPSYHATTEEKRRTKFPGFKFPIRTSEISRPVPTDPEQFQKWEARSSPIAPHVQRPPTALHPAYSPSRYSTTSRLSRF